MKTGLRNRNELQLNHYRRYKNRTKWHLAATWWCGGPVSASLAMRLAVAHAAKFTIDRLTAGCSELRN